ncbi:MAG: PilZ domain-containing protein [Desulfuromonadaceae bacterium]|nr:PilZ domain-containing protein [Desulfuromonadaceae bacterium]
MLEKRRFHRVPFSTKTVLAFNGATYSGQLENISMSGALIRLEHGTTLPLGNKFGLTVHVADESVPLQLVAEIVCVPFAMAGIKFISYQADTRERLSKLVESLSADTDIAMANHEKRRRQLANQLREE